MSDRLKSYRGLFKTSSRLIWSDKSNVNSLPVVNAGANQTICNSQSVTLTGSGSATSYTWNNGAINGTAFTPTISNSYIVTGTDLNNCSNTDTMDVTVNSILTLTLSADTGSICSGATATLPPKPKLEEKVNWIYFFFIIITLPITVTTSITISYFWMSETTSNSSLFLTILKSYVSLYPSFLST